MPRRHCSLVRRAANGSRPATVFDVACRSAAMVPELTPPY